MKIPSPEKQVFLQRWYEGREAILREAAGVLRVRVSSLTANDQGVSARVECLHTPGLTREAGSSRTLSAGWDMLTLSGSYWGAAYVDWRLFWSASVVARVLEIAARVPEGATYHDERSKSIWSPKFPPKFPRFVHTVTPGPCERELMSYLDEAQDALAGEAPPEFLERMVAAYPAEERGFVFTANKERCLAYLDELKGVVAKMGDFDRFPEGPLGVVVYALLHEEMQRCPDAGDFGHKVRGAGLAVKAAAHALSPEMASPRPSKERWARLKSEGQMARRQGDLVTAERLLRAALEEARTFDESDSDHGNSFNNLANVCLQAGKLDEAEHFAREGLRVRREVERDGILVGNDLMFLACVLEAKGEQSIGEALRLAGEALPIYVATLGDAHREVAYVRSVVARLEARR